MEVAQEDIRLLCHDNWEKFQGKTWKKFQVFRGFQWLRKEEKLGIVGGKFGNKKGGNGEK